MSSKNPSNLEGSANLIAKSGGLGPSKGRLSDMDPKHESQTQRIETSHLPKYLLGTEVSLGDGHA